jgi:hypothetical protein
MGRALLRSEYGRDPIVDRVADYRGQSAISTAPWPPPDIGESITRADRRRVLEEWIDFFSEPHPIEHLTLWCRVTDELLRAVSAQTQLTSLTVQWGPYSDMSAVAELTNLVELDLRGASAVTDISPLASMSTLTHVHIENARKLRDYSPLGELAGLRYLGVDRGITGARADADSLEFLRGLDGLQTLYWDPRVATADYTPVLSLIHATEISVTPMKGQSPSMVDLEWALPGMRAFARRVADQRVPVHVGDEIVGMISTNVVGTMQITPAEKVDHARGESIDGDW